MAYATRYTMTWIDVNGITWLVNFQEDGYGGGTTAVTPGATPLILRWIQSDKYQPIVGSTASFQIKYDSTVEAMFPAESQELKAVVKRNGTDLWYGFISPGQYFRAFNNPVHFVTLTAADGLGELKNIRFETGGDPYYGQAKEIVVIANILQKTGHNLDILEGINIFDDGHSTAATDSPLDQTYVYQEGYWDEQTDERSDCYRVLEDIVRKYGATVKQSAGTWCIYRPNTFVNDSITYREFTYAGVYNDNDTFTSYNSIGASMYYIRNDQEITRLMGLGECQVTQDPPKRKNMFKNGSFDSFTWTAGVPDYWSEGYTSGTTLNASEDNNQLKMLSCGNAAIPTEYLECDFNIDFPTSATLSLDWTPTYTGSPSFKTLVLQIYSVTYSDYLTPSGWQASAGYYSFTAGTSGDLLSESIDIPLQDGYGRGISLRVRIYEFYNENAPATNYFHLNNLRLEVDSDKPETKIYTYDNPATLNNISSLEMALGDSWRRDFGTSLSDDSYFIQTTDGDASLTTDWSIIGDQTAAAPIAEVLARQTVEGFRKSLDLFRGSIRSAYFFVPHLAFEDSDFTDEYGFNKKFYPKGISYNARLNEWSGEWIECPATYADEGLEWASHDCGGDATITANSIEVNNWTNPGGDGNFAYFDGYTAIAGETLRVVLTLTDDGSSTMPWLKYEGITQATTWGTNYYTFYNAGAGEKNVTLRDWGGGNTFNFTAVCTIYSITGV